MSEIVLDDMERELLRDCCLDRRMVYYNSEYRAMMSLKDKGLVKNAAIGEWIATAEGRAWSIPATQPAPDAQPAGDRDAMLRNDLFGRVQNVLDGCNPAVATEFGLYRNLAEKQIQERDATIADLQAEVEAARGERDRYKAALEPFAEAWLDVPLGLRSVLRVWNGETGEDSKYPKLASLSTDTLQGAHTAYYTQPAPDAATTKQAGEGNDVNA